MKTVTIHQPYFFPWLGYFNKLAQSDCFVVLDDVGFRNRFYLNRARILLNSGAPMWLTVPVGDHPGRPVNQIFVEPGEWTNRSMRTLEETYSRCASHREVLACVTSVLPKRKIDLASLCLESIKAIALYSNLRLPEIIMSSKFSLPSDRTDRLIALCRELNATDLLLGRGSSLMTHDLKRIQDHGIRIRLQDFLSQHTQYRHTQIEDRNVFIPGLSVIDAAMNLEKDTLMYEVTRTCVTDLNDLSSELLVQKNNKHHTLPNNARMPLLHYGDGLAVVEETRQDSGSRKSTRIAYVDKPDAVLVVAVDAHNRVILIRRHRVLTGEPLYELPGGRIENGESELDAARRELFEETGITPQSIAKVGSFWSLPSITNERAHVFLAKVETIDEKYNESDGIVCPFPIRDVSAEWGIKNVSFATDLAALLVGRDMLTRAKQGQHANL